LSDILFYDFEGDVVVFAVDDDDSVVLQSKHSMIKGDADARIALLSLCFC